MAYVTDDRVAELTTVTGTGAAALLGAIAGCDTFAAAKRADGSAIQNGDVLPYYLEAVDANKVPTGAYESGIGTYNSASGVTRTTVLRSSNADAAVSFAAGDKIISIGLLASRIVQLDDVNAVTLPVATSLPATPAAGYGQLFLVNRAGKVLLKTQGPSGLDEMVQPSLWGNSWVEWLPGTGTTLSINAGTSWTARNSTGAQSHPTTAITNLYTMMNRAEFAAGAVAAQSSGVQSSRALFARGNAAKLGGFFFAARFGIGAGAAGSRFFCGLSAQNASWATDPSSVNNTCGVGADAADTNLQIITRDGTTASKIDTGVAKTVTSVPFDFYMFCAPNDNKITFRLVRLDTDAVLVNNVEKTTNLPVNTTLMYAWANASSSSAAASTLGLARLYCQADI